MNTPRFVHDDIIRVISTGQIGRVEDVHLTEIGYVYEVQVRVHPEEMMDVLEDDLALL
jgi:hypothetical protein